MGVRLLKRTYPWLDFCSDIRPVFMKLDNVAVLQTNQIVKFDTDFLLLTIKHRQMIIIIIFSFYIALYTTCLKELPTLLP